MHGNARFPACYKGAFSLFPITAVGMNTDLACQPVLTRTSQAAHGKVQITHYQFHQFKESQRNIRIIREY